MTALTGQEPATPAAQPAGFLQDPGGDFSSKRFESFLAFVVAAIIGLLDVALAAGGIHITGVPIVELVGTLLAYSAAMQGVSLAAERNLFPQGLNTTVSKLLPEVTATENATNLAGARPPSAPTGTTGTGQ